MHQVVGMVCAIIRKKALQSPFHFVTGTVRRFNGKFKWIYGIRSIPNNFLCPRASSDMTGVNWGRRAAVQRAKVFHHKLSCSQYVAFQKGLKDLFIQKLKVMQTGLCKKPPSDRTVASNGFYFQEKLELSTVFISFCRSSLSWIPAVLVQKMENPPL